MCRKSSRPRAFYQPACQRSVARDSPNKSSFWARCRQALKVGEVSKGATEILGVHSNTYRAPGAWRTSNTLEHSFCVEALKEALSVAVPEIFKTDQGAQAQFTCEAFVQELLSRGVGVSMDGRGRALDNVFVERLWRSVKYEEVYLKEYSSVSEGTRSPGRYFRFYNRERPHQALAWIST